MKVRTSRRILLWLAIVVVGTMTLLALAGNQEARRELPAQVVVWTMIGLMFVAGWWFKVRPRRELHRDQAGSLRLTTVAGDPLGFSQRPFVLLGQISTAKDIESTSWGTWRGMDVAVFDYWFARSGRLERSDYLYWTCASMPVPTGWPDISIVPERLWSRLARLVGEPHVEFELESFNRAFQVRSRDRRFASALIDARMIEWLLGLPVGTGVEILGGTLLCQTPRRPEGDVRWALETMAAFTSRVPPAAGSLYGQSQPPGLYT